MLHSLRIITRKITSFQAQYYLNKQTAINIQNLFTTKKYGKKFNNFNLDGIPIVKSYGFSGEYNILVMELLFKSLEDLFQECNGRFSLKTVCMLADQMVTKF